MRDQRPEWMPSIWSVDRLCGGISELEPFVSVEMRRTGLRAQIAVLEELPVGVVKGKGDGYMDRFILLKIAALRKELGA